MESKNTIESIGKYTGLKYDYIRKCNKKLKDVLNPYITYGDKNILLYDSNAVVIFDQIKQLKEQGLNLNQIAEKIVSKQPKNNNHTLPNMNINLPQHDYIEMLLKDLKETNKAVILAKDETIQTQVQTLETQKRLIIELENKVLLLTDGRNPEEVRTEIYNKELKMKEQEEKLSFTETSLKHKDLQLQQLQQQENEKTAVLENNRLQRQEILNQLKAIEGKLFKKKQRLELLSQLENLA